TMEIPNTRWSDPGRKSTGHSFKQEKYFVLILIRKIFQWSICGVAVFISVSSPRARDCQNGVVKCRLSRHTTRSPTAGSQLYPLYRHQIEGTHTGLYLYGMHFGRAQFH